MEKTTDDITFKLLANPIKFKRDNKNNYLTEGDELFLKINKIFPGILILDNDKKYILKKIETLLIEVTIKNIIDNLVKVLEYESLL